MGDLSLHFSKVELCCRHCQICLVSPRLLNALEKLRSLGPEPIIVNDGYRCEEHNEAVGGAKHSEHVTGEAADVVIKGLTLQQMYERAVRIYDFANGGVGVYTENFIHVDVRTRRARWARKNGVYLAINMLVTPVFDTTANA